MADDDSGRLWYLRNDLSSRRRVHRASFVLANKGAVSLAVLDAPTAIDRPAEGGSTVAAQLELEVSVGGQAPFSLDPGRVLLIDFSGRYHPAAGILSVAVDEGSGDGQATPFAVGTDARVRLRFDLPATPTDLGRPATAAYLDPSEKILIELPFPSYGLTGINEDPCAGRCSRRAGEDLTVS